MENDRNVRGGGGYVVIPASVVATIWERYSVGTQFTVTKATLDCFFMREHVS